MTSHVRPRTQVVDHRNLSGDLHYLMHQGSITATMKTTIVILLLLLGISGAYNYQNYKHRDDRKWHHQMEARKELLAILARARWAEGPITITNDYFTLSNVVIINESAEPGLSLNGNHYAAHNLYSFNAETMGSFGSVTKTNFPASNWDTTETK